jgi:DNA-binding winged helix-turn-helix (wHTH) protein
MNGNFRVGPWLAEPSLDILTQNRRSVHIEPKVMEVLVCLADRAGETVSKETLLRTVWPNTFVSDDALTRCISELRRALEDSARNARFIQTIPRRGYRLMAPVVPVLLTKSGDAKVGDAAERTSFESIGSARWARAFLVAFALLGLLVAAYLLWNRLHEQPGLQDARMRQLTTNRSGYWRIVGREKDLAELPGRDLAWGNSSAVATAATSRS